MKAWQKYEIWFAARVPREKVIVAAALVGGILFLGYTYGVEPALLQARRDIKAVQDLMTVTRTMEAQATAMKAQSRDPDAPLRNELEQLKGRLATQARRFEEVERSLVPPEKMSGLLESLLSRSRGLQLVGLQTLPPTPVLERKAAVPVAAVSPAAPVPPAPVPAGEAGLYKHGVELKVSGSYADLMAYLTALENAPQRLIWGRMELNAEQYPRSHLTLIVYTLSLDSSWLIL